MTEDESCGRRLAIQQCERTVPIGVWWCTGNLRPANLAEPRESREEIRDANSDAVLRAPGSRNQPAITEPGGSVISSVLLHARLRITDPKGSYTRMDVL